MATAKRNSKAATKPELSPEERQIVDAYRGMSRWEKNAVFLVLQSVANGNLTEQTDNYSWVKMSRKLGLGKAVRHD